ncbi:MAG: nucleotide exchange factor GrpE [Clostridia bacterium]
MRDKKTNSKDRSQTESCKNCFNTQNNTENELHDCADKQTSACEEGCQCNDECSCGCDDQHECDQNIHCEECEKNLIEEKQDYIKIAQQLQADFDNYRKRSEQIFEDATKEGIALAINSMLPAYDAIVNSISLIVESKVHEGLQMVEKQIISSFSNLGIEKLPSCGTKYDPNLHNVVALSHDKNIEDDIITQEYQSGFKLGDKILRHGQVVINKKGE